MFKLAIKQFCFLTTIYSAASQLSEGIIRVIIVAVDASIRPSERVTSHTHSQLLTNYIICRVVLSTILIFISTALASLAAVLRNSCRDPAAPDLRRKY